MSESSPPVLPTFIIVGAARCGTTSLYSWLKQHPRVFMSPVKETGYFSDGLGGLSRRFKAKQEEPRANGRRWRKAPSTIRIDSWEKYLALFEAGRDFPARGEASPSYLYYHQHCAQAIRAALPDCKVVIILRDPVERTISHYKGLVISSGERAPLEAAFALEKMRLEQGLHWTFDYRGASCYASMVERYLEVFPRNQVGVWLFEHLMDDPRSLYDAVCQFVGAGASRTPPRFRAENANAWGATSARLKRRSPLISRTYETLPTLIKRSVDPLGERFLRGGRFELSPATRLELRDYFSDDVERLQQLLPELDFRPWTTGR